MHKDEILTVLIWRYFFVLDLYMLNKLSNDALNSFQIHKLNIEHKIFLTKKTFFIWIGFAGRFIQKGSTMNIKPDIEVSFLKGFP